MVSRPVSFGNSQPPRVMSLVLWNAHLPTKSTAAPLGEVIPCVGEWKRVTPEWRNTSEKKKRGGGAHTTPAALQRNMVTSWATSGIMGSESENEGVRIER